ncbi:MAG: penicillin-binding protein activator [Desulfobacterales bacterium]|nr:penicillin-binding protein activator [Desulfobacterales bacterium]
MKAINQKNILNPLIHINSHPGIGTQAYRHAALFCRWVVLMSALLFLSCTPKVVIKPEPVEIDPGNALFSRAEKMFQSKSYDRAFELYQRFLFQFSYRLQADDALMRIAKIYEMENKTLKARESYQRLTTDYPKSPFVQNAMMKMLFMLYKEGKYTEVIQNSANVLEKTILKDHIFRIHLLLGGSYLAVSQPEEAANSFIVAYQQSKKGEKANVIQKLTGAIGQLEPDRLIFLFKEMDDELLSGYLLYQLGIGCVDEKKFESAVQMLSLLVQKFPKHEKTHQAKALLEELQKKSLYQRYTIGCLLPLSGPYKIYGNKVLKGIELALGQYTDVDSGPTIKIIIKDTESDPQKAVQAVGELYEERVAAIIGPLATATQAASEAQKRELPIITLTQKREITDVGDYVFRNFITPGMQVKTLVSYAIKKLQLKRFAILYPDENYGKTFMNLFWDEVIALGGKVVGAESYNINHTDFADPIKKLVGLNYDIPEDLKYPGEQVVDKEIDHNEKENNDGTDDREAIGNDESETETAEEEKEQDSENPEAIVDFDVIFIPDAPNKAGLIIPQLAFYDIEDVYLFGTNLWHSKKLIKMARHYAQNAILADGFYSESTLKVVKNFVESFEKTYGEKPGFIEAVAFDTASILFKMVGRPDIRLRTKLKDELMNLRDFEGASGRTSFDDRGEAWKKLYLLKIKGDKFIEIN